MNLSGERFLPVLILTLFVGGTFWLKSITAEPSSTANEVRQDPDFIGEMIHLTHFDGNGHQDYSLIADKIVHHPATDINSLEQPRLHHVQEQARYDVRANYGETRRGSDEIYLRGDVLLVRRLDPSSPKLTLAASSLTVWPDTEQAASEEAVVLTQGNNRASADRLRANNLFGTLLLAGNAKLQIPPSSRAPSP